MSSPICEICSKPAAMYFRVPKLSDSVVFTCDTFCEPGCTQAVPGVRWCCIAKWVNAQVGRTRADWGGAEILDLLDLTGGISRTYL